MSAAPEWRTVLEKQLEEHSKASVYSFATSDPKPHVRYIVHREFSPSHLLLTTTDRRMAKTRQFEHGAAIAWMFPSMIQVRLEGRAILYPSALPSSTSALEDAKALAATFPDGAPEADPEWWENKRKDLWAALSSELRASFCRPRPGMQLQDDPDHWVDDLPVEDTGVDEKTKTDMQHAWENFAVLALQPESAEVLDLGSKPHTRTQWTQATHPNPRKTDVVP